jgi:hypothetical protein
MSAFVLASIWLGLVIGNAISVPVSGVEAATAVERSFFQALPLIVVWIVQYLATWRPA